MDRYVPLILLIAIGASCTRPEKLDMAGGIYMPIASEEGEWGLFDVNGNVATDNDTAWISHDSGIVSADFTGSAITGVTLSRLAENDTLKSLNVAATGIGDADAAVIGTMRSLTEVNLSGTQITDAGLVAIAKLPHLEVIYLDNVKVSGQGILHLVENPTVRHISMRDTHVPQPELRRLMDANPKVTFVSQRGLEGIY